MNRDVFNRHRWDQHGSFMEKSWPPLATANFDDSLYCSARIQGWINQSRAGPTNYDCVAVDFWDSLELFITPNRTEEGGITVQQKHKKKWTFIDPENSPIFMTEVGYDVGGTITL